ncbi:MULTISPECIES: efflux RND transporter periplasmic adaptor subunit [unclassified Pseudomonas]|uniref:efflux RND transporter periplasmic adaptor subunit n=1 Tax=unclassified Pseudomonas TaxID=196821 RepID=UPI0012978154|nr:MULTISPECIES: efflux RND transporter periplasmic adaptor subunit [unclassified Pseudomonas]MQT43873.1 efflux RND transporter periplasmic adaptor subunit [Pseudomonas sp. FSL R10-0765]MQT54440.1 efflux RND transporter periplasmic adaptor subunit [Pseudomonas sp. FSL R10-2398]MQU03802.1 efflux RND transporter periplasmic adaptor subunit [Pseudomonas sp. FSL R10-2245]MQU14445.1 efflux RND transporter periplasmic adaptor subunit [Pseudomonas sp. FSL R10-2189]MQU39956.1 efflux RND transporter pe
MSTKLFAKSLVTAAVVVAVLVLFALGGCSADDAPPVAQTPKVQVMTVQPQCQALTTELAGRTQAFMLADIRPQVGGIVQQRLFVEGAEVKAGQALYQIDPAPYKATLAEAQATASKARATLKSAQATATRNAALVKIDAISQQDNEDAQVSLLTAQAELQVAQAGVDTARINLGYTRITSPLSGRIETSTVTPGALLVAAQTTALTTVQQLDPIYVDITQSTTELLRLKRDLASGALQGNSAEGEAPVLLTLDDGSPYNHAGTLKFSGVAVNQGTGTVTLRAVFANPEHLLLPGMYVRAVLELASDDKAILIPQKAVTRSASGVTSVLVVVNGKVEQRVLTIDRAVGNQWWVSAGLNAGDQVIIEGGQKVRVGAEVLAQNSDARGVPRAVTPTAIAQGN